MTAILQVFGAFLLWLYKFCHSYALALIIFTLLTKVVLFPLSYKGKKGMMQMNTLQVEMNRLQQQYGKNRAKYNEEVQKLYQREGINPMSGCLWSFLPLPILMALYYIIRRPMLYMMRLSKDQVTAAIDAVKKLGDYTLSGNAAYQEMQVAGLMYDHSDVLDAVTKAVGDGASRLEVINFHWLGLDLSQVPKLKFWENGITWASVGLFLIPIVVTVLNVAYSRLSMRTNNFNKNQKNSNPAADQTTRMMTFVMPLMYLWFGFIMPAGMCVYMMFNAIFMAIQEVICARLLRGKYAEMEAERQRRAEEEKELERQRKAEIAARRAAEAEERKKNAGKKNKQKNKQHKTPAPKESRVGMRTYARGRAYDPGRYPVTPYRDPDGGNSRATIEATFGEEAAEEVPDVPVTGESLPETPAAETAPEETVPAEEVPAGESPAEPEPPRAEAPEEESAAPATADEMFAKLREETEGEEE